MKRRRDLLILAVLALVAAVILPQRFGAPDLDRTATALALAGPGAAAAIALVVGRPSFAPGLLAGVGAYVSGALALRGVPVPAAVPLATLAGALGGAAVALITVRLDIPALLAATLLAAIGVGALAQALPQQSGGQAGLGPLPPLGSPLPGSHVVHLTPTGDLHALLAAALAITLLAASLLSSRWGALWRAVGSDRERSSASGLRPLRAELIALAIAGAVAGLGGALSTHLNGVATPEAFSADAVALPLLAALLAGRGSALGAVVAAVGTGLLGGVILPDLGWRGPPSAPTLALGLLAIAVVASLLPSPETRRRRREGAAAADLPWPITPGEFRGAGMVVEHLQVRSGTLLVLPDVSLRVDSGRIHGVVGPNGAGKSTLLRALSSDRSGQVRLEAAQPGAVVVLQPQAGGGFPACTARETLQLAGRGGGRSDSEALAVADAWLHRLDLDALADTFCADLAAGQRRLLDLARVLMRRPAVMLCDEPLAGLDAAWRAAAVSLLQTASEAGLTIVLAEHDRAAVARLASQTTELTRTDLAAAPAPAAP